MKNGINPSLLADGLTTELQENLLPFWRERSVDTDQGRFVSEMDDVGQVINDTNLALVFHARLLWTFSALFRMASHPRDRQLADLARLHLYHKFRDRTNGGYYWEVNQDGEILDSLKRVYGQAFTIYALSESYRAFRYPKDRQAAIDLFNLLEEHAHDHVFGGYFEVCHEDWSIADNQRLSNEDQVAPKSMNNHLHVLEAYTNLYRIWPETRLRSALQRLLDVFDRYILNAERTHLGHFFGVSWEPCSTSYTYGHDIEAAWLLCEAAEVLEDRSLIATTNSWATTIASAVMQEGLDPNGGLMYEGSDGQVLDCGKTWWPQAEALVGFLQTYLLTRDISFFKAAASVWEFIQHRIIDREHGEWHWQITSEGRVDPTQPKISAWKGPYHNIRMCIEGLRLLALLHNNHEMKDMNNEFDNRQCSNT